MMMLSRLSAVLLLSASAASAFLASPTAPHRRAASFVTRSSSTVALMSEEGEVASAAAASETPELAATEEKRKIERDRHTMFIGNLPFDTTETTIKELFGQFGVVELVTIPRDRRTEKPRGFAFVDMGSAEAVDAAIAAIDGTTFGGRQIRVGKSVPKDEISKQPQSNKPRDAVVADGTKKIYVGNIPFGATKEELMDYYGTYGEVLEVYIPTNQETGTGRGFAFVTMKEEDADKAIEATNGAEFEGRRLVVNEPLPPGIKAAGRKTGGGRTKLYVGNLSFYTVPQTLQDLFGEFGEVLDCYLPEDISTGGSRGFGFVTMARSDALRAIAEVDGCEIDGRVIRVNEAQPKKRSDEMNNDMGEEELGVISGAYENVDQE